MEKQSFTQAHGDTIAIIGSTLGVNIAIAAIMISMWVSNTHRVDAANERIDATNNRIDATLARIDGFYQVLMNKPDFSHNKGFRAYDDVVPKPDNWMIKDPSIKKDFK